MKNTINNNKLEDASKYDGMKNEEFLVNYFRDHCITEDEIALYRSWGGFQDLGRGVQNDEHGMAYAQELVESIIAYRDITLDDLRENYNNTPWAWPSAMRFQKIYNGYPSSIGGSLNGRVEIYLCIYEDKEYFFNVGKEEPQGGELQELLIHGSWLVYTYSD